MKILQSLLAIALTTLSSLTVAQIKLPVEEAPLRSLLVRPELLDGLMIATALGPPVGRTFGGDAHYVAQRVRVEDSRAFPMGSVVDVVFRTWGGSTSSDVPKPGVPFDLTDSLPVGIRVLLIARVAEGSAFQMPGFGDLRGNTRVPLDDGASGPTVFGEGWYLTAASRLASDPAPRWRFLGSLAAAIPNTSDENARRITAALAYADDTDDFGGSDDRFSRTFADAVARDTAYHRALVDVALNSLDYRGYEIRFGRDLRESATDPNAFPDDIPSLTYHRDLDDPVLRKLFEQEPPLTQADQLALLARAKSPTIAASFLQSLKERPSKADVRVLAAKYLNFSDPRARFAMVERLAAWSGEPKPAGPQATSPNSYSRKVAWVTSPGLDAAVAAWKTRLGLP